MNSYFTPSVLDAIREVLASEKNAKSSINEQVRDAIREALAQEHSSIVTTTYGNFYNHIGAHSVEIYVADAFGSERAGGGEGSKGFDVQKIISDLRDEINDALPESVSLCGNEFYGPYYQKDQKFEGYPVRDDGSLDIKKIIDGIDFWTIVARHDLEAGEDQ